MEKSPLSSNQNKGEREIQEKLEESKSELNNLINKSETQIQTTLKCILDLYMHENRMISHIESLKNLVSYYNLTDEKLQELIETQNSVSESLDIIEQEYYGIKGRQANEPIETTEEIYKKSSNISKNKNENDRILNRLNESMKIQKKPKNENFSEQYSDLLKYYGNFIMLSTKLDKVLYDERNSKI